MTSTLLMLIYSTILWCERASNFIDYSGLVRSYLALSKIKEALRAARVAMKAMPQSAKALKLVGDVHASSTTGREKVCLQSIFPLFIQTDCHPIEPPAFISSPLGKKVLRISSKAGTWLSWSCFSFG